MGAPAAQPLTTDTTISSVSQWTTRRNEIPRPWSQLLLGNLMTAVP